MTEETKRRQTVVTKRLKKIIKFFLELLKTNSFFSKPNVRKETKNCKTINF